MDRVLKTKLIRYLERFTTEQRIGRIKEVLAGRTRHLTVVLEDVYQPHNASAVLRSCDCFGVQDVHIIENDNRFDPSTGVSLGSDQWLTMYRYRQQEGADSNTGRCIDRLREGGYTIVAMTPHRDEVSIAELPVDRRTALLFGTELEGLSEFALERADRFAVIPMYGFSESFNISVSAALTLYEMVPRLRRSDVNWRLSEEERIDLRLEWLQQSIRAGEELTRKFLEENSSA